jgi:arsenite methyltransferase
MTNPPLSPPPGPDALDVETAVIDRYTAGASRAEAELCCPVDYDPKFLSILPAEIVERDYGCGDPSAHVREGERVLDLGSGGGKICYILSQRVGPNGAVVGVDMNDAMLDLAEKYRAELAQRIGWANVRFLKGKIQDLRTDLRACEAWLRDHPVGGLDAWTRFEAFREEQRAARPLIPDASFDVVVSNCVLNLVRSEEKQSLFGEIFRVLARGGRAVISDIVADEPVPEELRRDPELWSGCISGAMRETEFLDGFVRAGFHGVEILKWEEKPWRTVHGIEFRSLTVVAHKGKQGPCIEKNQAVVYRGPFSAVEDDDGHRFPRGERMAVCEKTFNLLKKSCADHMVFIQPREPVAADAPFNCKKSARRHPRQTKGLHYDATTEPADDCCGPGSNCC